MYITSGDYDFKARASLHDPNALFIKRYVLCCFDTFYLKKTIGYLWYLHIQINLLVLEYYSSFESIYTTV